MYICTASFQLVIYLTLNQCKDDKDECECLLILEAIKCILYDAKGFFFSFDRCFIDYGLPIMIILFWSHALFY